MTESSSGWLVDYGYMDKVQKGSGVNLAACYQCRKCSNGCPVSFTMDLRPEQIVRLIAMGAKDRVEQSSTIWICASCQTCLTRCPNDVDIPRLMDFLKEEMVKRGEKGPQPDVNIFHQCFLRDMAKRGRVFEGGMMQNYLLKTGKLSGSELIKNAKMGLSMFKKGRLALLPKGIKNKAEIKALFKKTGGAR
jgi:heterodisulfide reductase subunit C